jgi:hypothetical protein
LHVGLLDKVVWSTKLAKLHERHENAKDAKHERREGAKAGWLAAGRCFDRPFVRRVHEATDAQWLLAEIDRQTHPILAFGQVEQTLLYISG